MSDGIRGALPADYELVGELTVAAYRATGMIDGNDAYMSTLLDTADRAEKAEVYVVDGPAYVVDSPARAVEPARLLGTVTIVGAGTPYSEVARDDELEFRMLAVAPAAQGRGLGTSLVAFCAEQALARGLRGLVLCTRDINVAAIRLYERLGFQRAPERDLVPVPGVNLLVLTKVV